MFFEFSVEVTCWMFSCYVIIFQCDSQKWKCLTFMTLQTAPLDKLKRSFLNDVDILMRSAVKQIIGLPVDTPNGFLYTSRRKRASALSKPNGRRFCNNTTSAVGWLPPTSHLSTAAVIWKAKKADHAKRKLDGPKSADTEDSATQMY